MYTTAVAAQSMRVSGSMFLPSSGSDVPKLGFTSGDGSSAVSELNGPLAPEFCWDGPGCGEAPCERTIIDQGKEVGVGI